MVRSRRKRVFLGACLLWAGFVATTVHAQDTQFLPEIDAHLKLNSWFRTYLQAKDDRDGGDPAQFTFGPSVQIFLKPLIKLRNATIFDLDDAKSRPLVFESGYRIVTAPDTPDENRAIEAVTLHLPLWGGFIASDRNRADLDWKSQTFTWRYRNKLTIERTISVRSYHMIPYVAAEPFYESQYNKWSATDLYVGSLFPVGRHVEFNLYYEHENDTAKDPNRQNNYVGFCVYLFFSLNGQH